VGASGDLSGPGACELVFVNSFSDENAGVTRHPMSPSWPLQLLTTVTFSEREDRTTLALRGGPLDATAAERSTFEAGFESMQKSFTGTFDQLSDYLSVPSA
jgi:hypothetical protein